MPLDWEQVVKDMKFRIDEIKAHVKYYDYSDQENSLITDEKLVEYMQDELRKAKSMLFDITDISFGRQINLSKDFQNLRDELDIFLDEIKLRHCEWKGLNEEWIKKIIKTDLDLINGIKELNKKLDHVRREILDFKQIKIKDHTVVYEPDFWKETEKDYWELKNMIDHLVFSFKEREVICNIKRASIEKTLKKIEKELKEKI